MVEAMRVELGAGVRPVVIEGELFARRVVTVSGVIVVLMTFLFSFGNVLNLGLYLGVPETVAWLVAPALDVTVIGLVVGIRHLSMHGASGETLKPVRIMLIMAGIATLVLNTADALLVRNHFGAAAYDAVGPVLLMAWTEAGPWFLRQFASGGVPVEHVPVIGSNVRSDVPSNVPSDVPSGVPVIGSHVRSGVPSDVPVGSHVRSDVPVEHVPVIGSNVRSDVPSNVPSDVPSGVPVIGSHVRSGVPSNVPGVPSNVPDVPVGSHVPSGVPSNVPGVPSNVPSDVPVGSHVRSDVPVEHVPVIGSEVLSEVPVIGSGRTVRDRLVKLFASNPEAMGWRHVDLAAAVGCSRSAVTRVLPVPDV